MTISLKTLSPHTAQEVAARLAACGGCLLQTDFITPSFDDRQFIASAESLVADGCAEDLFTFTRTADKFRDRIEVRLTPKVGMGATLLGYSDRHPYEIVRIVSATCIEVREMHAEGGLKPDHQFVPGGFVGHVVNQASAQEWTLSSIPHAPVVRLRMTRRGWAAKGERFTIGAAIKFYDFNF